VNQNDSEDINSLIDPCWKKIKPHDTRKVTLTINFNIFGSLSKPPSIIRDRSIAVDENLLKSESAAIMAIKNCGPYIGFLNRKNVTIILR